MQSMVGGVPPNPQLVTPAKAGVQRSRFHSRYRRRWIPAFAGMTERG